MNIKILDSWLREYLHTKATPQQIAEKLSLCSVSVERLEKVNHLEGGRLKRSGSHDSFKVEDYIYDIEITTNRPDLMSVVGLAREAATVLTQNKIQAAFTSPRFSEPKTPQNKTGIEIKNNPRLVNRICAVVVEVTVKPTPQKIIDRLEASGMRSLNNLIDITNYLTRTIGHPSHVFDFDRLASKHLTIRESKPGEKIIALDKKTYTLPGGDIVAVDDKNRIVDLLGIIGLENSIVTNETKKILFFIDNNDHVKMRRTSMNLNIRSEAVILNEKGPDPELAWDTFLYGIKMFEELADGEVISGLMDIYPNKVSKKTITVSEHKINSVIGIPVSLNTSAEILKGLGFEVNTHGTSLTASPPSFRANDIEIPEDLIEEIARIYGYNNIPNSLPPITETAVIDLNKDEFYWERAIKESLKYWGFTEVYTYSMVSDKLLESNNGNAVKIKNPLSSDFVYMRKTLTPSLLNVIKENPGYDTVNLFEIANVYENIPNKLPSQTLHLAAAMKNPKITFYHAKGIIEQLLNNLGINEIQFNTLPPGKIKISILKDQIGQLQIQEEHTITFELDLEIILKYATTKKIYTPVSKFPPVLEDIALIVPFKIPTGDIITAIKKQNKLIKNVTLLDKYQDTRTFHIIYQSNEKNLTSEEVGDIRAKILESLKDKFNAKLKQ